MWTTTLELHDASSFPILYATDNEQNPLLIEQWQHEMNTLISQDTAFVIIFPPHHTADDTATTALDEAAKQARKQRALWVKQHRDRLAHTCKGLISIEENSVKRAIEIAKFAVLEKAFGVPFKVAASKAAAHQLATELLAL